MWSHRRASTLVSAISARKHVATPRVRCERDLTENTHFCRALLRAMLMTRAMMQRLDTTQLVTNVPQVTGDWLRSRQAITAHVVCVVFVRLQHFTCAFHRNKWVRGKSSGLRFRFLRRRLIASWLTSSFTVTHCFRVTFLSIFNVANK